MKIQDCLGHQHSLLALRKRSKMWTSRNRKNNLTQSNIQLIMNWTINPDCNEQSSSYILVLLSIWTLNIQLMRRTTENRTLWVIHQKTCVSKPMPEISRSTITSRHAREYKLITTIHHLKESFFMNKIDYSSK